MVSRFKSIKRKNILLPVILILLILFLFKLIINKFINIKIYKSNSDLITYVVTNNNHLLPQDNNNYLSNLISFTTNIDIKKPVSIVRKTINFTIHI